MAVPSSLPPHAIGALCTDKDCNTFGWVFAYAPLENIAPAAIGRLALIRLRDGTELRTFGWGSFGAFASDRSMLELH